MYKRLSRQFVISKERVTPSEDWRHVELPYGWVLSHQEDLDIHPVEAPDGTSALILGNAYCLDSLEKGGSGRYAVLHWPYIYLDRAGGLLSIFYGQEDKAVVVSSNAGLVARTLRGQSIAPDFPQALPPQSTQQTYVPSPGSRYIGIRRMLRDQRLNIPLGLIERHPSPIVPLESYAAAVETVAAELCRFAHEVRARTAGTIFLQLTSGMDSRTVAAAFKAAGIAFETRTFGPIKSPDFTIARHLSQALGVPHSGVSSEAHDPTVAEIYREQTSDGVHGWDLIALFPGNAYRFVRPGDVMVGGACFEVGRQKFLKAFEGLTLSTTTGAELWQRLGREPGPPVFHAFLDEWLAWRRADPYPFNLVATHYLDQRLGAWAATIMAGYDLIEGLTIHPANNPRIFSALVTPDIEAQIEGHLQRDVIGALAPELLAQPFNPIWLRERTMRSLRRVRNLIRSLFAV